MSRVFLVFFLVYGAAHAYVLFKAKWALGLGPGATSALVPPLLALMLGPVISHHLGKHGFDGAAHAAAWIGYAWMGLLFFFLWTNLALDAVNVAARAGSLVLGTGARPAVPWTRTTFFAMAGIAAALGAYAMLEASRVGVDRVRIVTDKLPAAVPKLRIAQISDVHLGMLIRARMGNAIARVVRDAAPDVFVSTGDLVDARINHLEGLAEILDGIRAPLGKYAVTGNHEFYAGLDQALDFTRRSGFTVLRGQAVTVGGAVRIAGVDDETVAAFRGDDDTASARILATPSPLYTVLLKHRPLAAPAARGAIDLQLSGHTHDGQLWPFGYIVARRFPLITGLHPLGDGANLYVSRGTGTWGPPMRFLAPPAITIIDIERAPHR